MSEQHNIDQLLRDLTGDPLPTQAETDAARAQLWARITAPSPTPAAGHPRHVRVGWAAGLTAVMLIVALVVLPNIGSNVAQAALTEIAHATEALDPTVLPPGAYLHTRSEQTNLAILPGSDFPGIDTESVAYLISSTREIWLGDGGVVQVRTTNHTPAFFSPTTEQAYYQGGLDQLDALGEIVTLTMTGSTDPYGDIAWSDDPTQLRQQMLDHIHQGGSDLPDDVELFELSEQLLTETGAQPPLRAAILRVLAGIDLELIRTTPTGETQIAINETELRHSMTVDATGRLLTATTTTLNADNEHRIPAGTIIHQATYQPTTITTETR
jgi:hypothetical protein